ncbi:site-specific integrase [bacterium]|nr:site-specific integrase [bacterium]
MGTIRKRNGKFQAQIRRDGVPPLSKTFTMKKDAVVWVRGIEARIDAGEVNVAAPKAISLADLIKRYSQEITPLKKGRDTEQRRLSRLLRDPVAATPLSKLTSAKLAEFRDLRINDGLRAAQYDLILIKHCIKIARLEWGVSMPSNPVDSIRIPNGIKRRERRLNGGEYELLREVAQHCKNLLIWPMIDFAIETAMRRSEILSLRWENIDREYTIATLPDTKNGSKREVPLTTKAKQLLGSLSKQEEYVFPTSDCAVRHTWDRLVRRAGIKNLRFHDLRHEAVSRFFEMGLSVPEVALISGHRDYRMLASYAHFDLKRITSKL